MRNAHALFDCLMHCNPNYNNVRTARRTQATVCAQRIKVSFSTNLAVNQCVQTLVSAQCLNPQSQRNHFFA
jgi:hypothetical protein